MAGKNARVPNERGHPRKPQKDGRSFPPLVPPRRLGRGAPVNLPPMIEFVGEIGGHRIPQDSDLCADTEPELYAQTHTLFWKKIVALNGPSKTVDATLRGIENRLKHLVVPCSHAGGNLLSRSLDRTSRCTKVQACEAARGKLTVLRVHIGGLQDCGNCCD